jgi:hypothetical protein
VTALRDHAPPCLPHVFLSTPPPAGLPLHRHCSRTAAACFPTLTQSLPPRRTRSHPPDCLCRLHRGHLMHPYLRGVVPPLTRRRAAARPLSSFSTVTGDRTVGSRCAVLRPPGCQVLLKAHVASVCFKCFRCFQMFVTSVSDRCCKSRSECCICCNGCTRMLQRYVSNVSSMFSDVCC